LVESVKEMAEKLDSEAKQQALVNAVQPVASATAQMVTAAKMVASGQIGATEKLTEAHDRYAM
jgi:hypothetical protein